MDRSRRARPSRGTPALGAFERGHPHRELAVEQAAPRVIVFGLGRYDACMFGHLHEHGVPVPGVDFDPETVRAPRRRMFAAHFGDGADPAFLESLPLPGVEWAIATLPDWDGSRMLPHGLREAGCKGHVAALVRDESQVRALKQAGGARIVNPFSDAADHAAETFAREILSQEN